jgi:hypothetical protein
MSRKKTATKNNTSDSFQKIEKDFYQTPLALAKLLSKEIASLKQQQSTLKKLLQTAKSDAAKASLQIKKAGKLATAKGKKQLASAKKTYQAASKEFATLTKLLAAAQNAIHAAHQKQAELRALHKHLVQFASVKKKTLKKTVVKKAKQKAKKRKLRSTPSVVGTDSSASATFEHIDSARENQIMEEQSKVA